MPTVPLDGLSPERLAKVARHVATAWLVLLAASLAWNLWDERQQSLARAKVEARAGYENDLLYRRWATKHGGVYVPTTAETPPNPYLKDIPNRDVVTTTGQTLTLVNPAYMTRQVHEMAREARGTRGHITSLNPLRPENGPDPWEREALQTFARGVPEVSSLAQVDGAEFLRLMRPMRVEQGCLKCHERQGYRLGDIRGGISVSVPMAPYWAALRNHLVATVAFHMIIGGAGLTLLVLGYRRLEAARQLRIRAEEERQKTEQRWQAAIDSAGDGLWDWNIQTGEVYYSPTWQAMLGHEPGELRPHVDEWASRVHPEDRAQTEAAVQRHLADARAPYVSEHRMRCKDGTYKWILDRGRVIERDAAGQPRRMIGTHTDITARRQVDAELRASRERYRLLVDQVAYPVAVVSLVTGRVLYANTRAAEFFGYDGAIPAGTEALAHWREPARRNAAVRQLHEQGRVNTVEVELLTTKGESRWVSIAATKVEFDGESASFSVFEDVSQRRRADQQLTRISRLYAALCRVNEAIIRTANRETLLAEVCQALVAVGQFKIAWIGWRDAVTHAVPVVAQYGDDTGYLKNLSLTWDNRPEGQGPTGIAIREGRAYVCNNFAADLQTGPWRERAAHAGIQSSISLPIQIAGETVGALMAYAAEKDSFGDQEIALMERAAGDISFALEGFQHRAEHRQAESEFRMVFDSMIDGFAIHEIICDPAGRPVDYRFLAVNPAFERLTGLTAAVAVGRTVREILPATEEHWIETYGRVALTGEPVSFENYTAALDRHFEVSAFRPAPGRFACVFLDVTARKRAEAALRVRDRELELFFNQSLDGFRFMMLDQPVHWSTAVDPEALLDYILGHERITRANDAVAAQLGRTRQELIGRTPREIFAHDPETAREIWRQLYAAGQLRLEFNLRKPDGSTVWLEGEYTCLYNEQQAITGHFGVQRDVTLRKQAEAELSRSQARLARAMELGRMGGWEFSYATREFTFNDQFYSLFGTNAAREGGYVIPAESYCRDFLFPDDAAIIARNLERLRDDPAAVSGGLWEHRIRRRDGMVRHVQVRISAITDAEGLIVGARGVETDISERVESEAERRKLSRAVEQSPVTVVITNTTGAIEYANPQFTKSTGYTLEEVLGRNPRVLKSGVQPESVYREMWAAIGAGMEWHGEFCNRRKDGSLFWEEVNISPVFDEAGHITHYLAVKEDITNRRESLERMREQAALLDVSRDAIIVVDLVGNVRYWNHGAELIYGWSSQEAVGRQLFALVYDDANPPPTAARQAILADGEWNGELNQRTKAGTRIIARARGVLMRDPQGAPRSILLTATDVTEAKRFEAHFLRAQRLESVGALASGVAHDLNNVLSPIMMSVELLRPLAVTPGDRDLIRLMSDSARRGADVVRQLLLFGRGSDAPSETINVALVIKEVLRMVQETFPRNLTIESGIPPGLWPIRGHGTQIYQILLNLCVNARDAMPHGGQLAVDACNLLLDEHLARLNPGVPPGRFVELKVSDTGSGIPPEIIDRIFDPFFTTKEQGKGSGLGLSTVVGIAKSHGGFVTVVSRVGLGSEFRVYLPAIADQPEPSLPEGPGRAAHGHGETILVVDDEFSIRQILSRSLDESGYRVLVAADGTAALALACAHRDQLRAVILDMMMPGLDGLEVLQQLRAMKPDLAVVACSGLDRYGDELVNRGYTDVSFLRKPFTVEAALAALHAKLG